MIVVFTISCEIYLKKNEKNQIRDNQKLLQAQNFILKWYNLIYTPIYPNSKDASVMW